MTLTSSKFQLTRPVWGEPSTLTVIYPASSISTHSPRVGRTIAPPPRLFAVRHFNSLAPCGANHSSDSPTPNARQFQLTRPVWGEPMILVVVVTAQRHFNSLAPCGANRPSRCCCIAAPSFQLTRPVWGEPLVGQVVAGMPIISTHSPRVGRTRFAHRRSPRAHHFNSLAPCGANLIDHNSADDGLLFQLTRPVWGEPVDT